MTHLDRLSETRPNCPEHDLGLIWTRWLDDRAVKVFAPIDQTIADFALRMGALLGALAVAEDRSQLAVIADLYAAAAPADTLRDDRPSAAEVEP